ncbi:MAG: Cytochrome c551 peroxidase [Candidatus Omnitrophica bacterium]|nr:Cytochrome c551 peroxidase [Candidatus Omnitrophota bacterium]
MLTRVIVLLSVFFVSTSPILAAEANYPALPLGLDRDAYLVPEDNPITPEKVELGKLLYFDKRISMDGTISCASCHHPSKGWADDKPTSLGVDGKTGNRNSPTVINTAFNYVQFWDGRASSLEEQAVGPMANPVEMAHTLEGVEQRIAVIEGYKPYFKAAFGDETVTIDRIAKAIASFERTVLSGNSKWDRHLAGDTAALSDAAKRGLELFEGKANCAQCHNGFNLTDGVFHNLGVGMNKPEPDLGRYEQTRVEKDKGAFKTPTLRDITRTAPYMHDGSQKTLEEVMDLYNKGGEPNAWLDPKMVPLNLTPEEISDIIEFMKSLEGDWRPMEEPRLPE